MYHEMCYHRWEIYEILSRKLIHALIPRDNEDEGSLGPAEEDVYIYVYVYLTELNLLLH